MYVTVRSAQQGLDRGLVLLVASGGFADHINGLLALLRSGVLVRASLDKQAHDLDMATKRCPVQWSVAIFVLSTQKPPHAHDSRRGSKMRKQGPQNALVSFVAGDMKCSSQSHWVPVVNQVRC